MIQARVSPSADAEIDFTHMFDLLPTAAAVLHDRVIVACNRLFAAMMKADAARLIGESFATLYAAPSDFDVRGKRVAEVLKREGSYADDRLLKRLDGEIFWCHISGQTLDRRSPYRKAIWTFVDLSTERRIESPIRASLTQRERDVATLLLEGLSSKEIARRLEISPRTVDIHRGSLLRKYGVSTTPDLLTNLVQS
ncbi:LuxR C-terminal-related transcriptional regulator [Achromobacter denitrificans]